MLFKDCGRMDGQTDDDDDDDDRWWVITIAHLELKSTQQITWRNIKKKIFVSQNMEFCEF